MNKRIIILLLASFLLHQGLLHAQAKSFNATALLLKKKGKTVKRFYPGSNMQFITTDGMKVDATVDRFDKDSLFMLFYDVRMMPTMMGTMAKDTAGVYPLAFSMKNIGSFYKPPKARLLSGAMILGGLAYTVVNIVNTTREGDPPFGQDNLPNVLAGIATAAGGVLINKLQPRTVSIGNKYTLEVVQ